MSDFYEVLAKQRNDAPELQQCVRKTVEQLVTLDTSSSRPGIILGKIQSGKTRAFLGVIAEAFDKGYQVAVVLTKGTISLAEQTIRRIEKDFARFLENDRVQVFDIMSLPPNLTKYHLSQKLIFVVKKEDDNLKHLITAFETTYPQLRSRKLLIVDDEADFASVTFRKADGEVSVGIISRKIDELRDLVKNSSFLQVTATPYSLYLQPEETIVRGGQPLFKPKRPAFTELLPIHPQYVGGDYYFEKSNDSDSPASYFYEEVPMAERETLKKPDRRRLALEDILTEKSVHVLRRAMMNFVVGAAVRRVQQQQSVEPLQKYSLLLHTEQSRDAHSWQETVATTLRDQLEKAASDNTPVFQQLLDESYIDIANSVLAAKLSMPSAQEVGNGVRDALTSGFLQITKVNSDRDAKELLDPEGQLKLSTPMNLFIGGQILDRGITIRNLIGFYYGRNPQKYQQDTVLQHSRMYGARPQADLTVTRFYAPRHIYQIMQKIHNFDTSLREAFLAGEHERGVYFIQKDTNDKLIPCSPNRLLFSKLTSIRPGGRLLPSGFQTVYKSYGKKKLEELDQLMNRVYGTQYGKVVMVDLVSAMQILELAHANMEYDENEDYDDERKGQLAALEHLALHNADPKKKGKVGIIAHVDRDIVRIRQDGRISNSPDSYQEKEVARQTAEDMPVLLMLRQNGKQEDGWRDLPFWWPVIFIPKRAVTSVFAGETPPEDAVALVGGSPAIDTLARNADKYLQKHFGLNRKSFQINRAIWSAIGMKPDYTLRLSEIDSIAGRVTSDPNEVLAVIALLCAPGSAFLKMNYLSDAHPSQQVPQAEVIERLCSWWRDRSLTDEEWRSWASAITVEWSPEKLGEQSQ